MNIHQDKYILVAQALLFNIFITPKSLHCLSLILIIILHSPGIDRADTHLLSLDRSSLSCYPEVIFQAVWMTMHFQGSLHHSMIDPDIHP